MTTPYGQHGTRTSYCSGCRCDECTVANRIYQRNYSRERFLAGRTNRHGVVNPNPAMEKVKRLAWNTVERLKREGVLIAGPCERCGRRPTEAHHDDYGKPAEVRWLCVSHHRLLHASLRWSERVAA